MANHTSLASLFSDIADAIRAKTGGSSNIIADNFPTAISQIPTGGGGGLEYEEGTWTPSENIVRPTISFVDAHITRPCSITISDVTGTSPASTNSMIYWAVFSWYDAFGSPAYGKNMSAVYGGIRWAYSNSSNYSANGTNINYLTSGTSQSYMPYVMTETGFNPYGGSSSYAWRAGRTYKWIAIWAPTT